MLCHRSGSGSGSTGRRAVRFRWQRDAAAVSVIVSSVSLAKSSNPLWRCHSSKLFGNFGERSQCHWVHWRSWQVPSASLCAYTQLHVLRQFSASRLASGYGAF